MKIKVFAIVFCLIISSLFVTCCAKDDKETTAPDYTWPEPETEISYTLDEMSPPTMETDIPIEVKTDFSSWNLYEFNEIEAKDSIIKNSQASKILKKDNVEFYYMDTDDKIFIIVEDEENDNIYSGIYKISTGDLEFIADSEKSWYFNPDGSLFTMVYTFSLGQNYKGVVSFYNPDGTRDFVNAAGGYYTGDLFPLTDEEAFPYLQKYAKTSELFKK